MRSFRRTLTLVGLTIFLVAFAIACGKSSSPVTPSPLPAPGGGGGADVTITILGQNGSQSFSPNPATVTAGQTVAWRNADSITHTATADNGSFNTGNIAPGATSAAIMMSAAGTVGYHCSIHPSMTGTLTVQ